VGNVDLVYKFYRLNPANQAYLKAVLIITGVKGLGSPLGVRLGSITSHLLCVTVYIHITQHVHRPSLEHQLPILERFKDFPVTKTAKKTTH
jgi:hypothetical protein